MQENGVDPEGQMDRVEVYGDSCLVSTNGETKENESVSVLLRVCSR